MLKTLEKFIQSGGTLEDAVDLMVTNFSDLPASVNKLIEMLHIAGMKKKEVQAFVEDHVKSLVLKHFDPRKADRIFTEAGSTPPWLEEMIGYSTWRNMIYQLAEQFPDCLLLKFAIKLISDAGYQSEITSATTAAKDFEVYSTLFASHLTSLACSTKQEVFESHLTEILKLSCHTDYTYVHAQAVLYSLELVDREARPLLGWLRQKIEKEASGKIQEPLKWTLLFKGIGAYPQLFEAMTSMLTRNTLNPADMATVYQHYSDIDQVPPSDFLRIPQFMDLLVQALFKHGSTMNPEQENKYTYLLAYAVSVWDQYSETLEGDPVSDELEETQKAIQQAYVICCKGSISHADLQSCIKELYKALQFPVVAKGVLLWLESILLSESFFEMSVENAILYFSLLDEISSNHKLHHPEVMNVLQRLFEASTPSSEEKDIRLDLQKMIVDRMIHLALCGHAVSVVSYLIQCVMKRSMDTSLVRHFVHEVLAVIDPPYSTKFASSFCTLLNNSDITGTMRNQEGSDPVSKFLESCSKKTKKRKR